jgi:hypothetical protein
VRIRFLQDARDDAAQNHGMARLTRSLANLFHDLRHTCRSHEPFPDWAEAGSPFSDVAGRRFEYFNLTERINLNRWSDCGFRHRFFPCSAANRKSDEGSRTTTVARVRTESLS